MKRECKQKQCNYYQHYLAYYDGTQYMLTHDEYHAKEQRLEIMQAAALRYEEEGRRYPLQHQLEKLERLMCV